MTSTAALPHLLLVEDDPVSRAFLADALSALPAQVDAVASIADAVVLARATDHALWLLDANLPDGDGLDCLAALRAIRARTPALAVTAASDRDSLARLSAGGFAEVLQKPMPVPALHAAVWRQSLGAPAPPLPATAGKLPSWDETQAMRAVGGQAATLATLRQLFLQELPAQRGQIEAAARAGDAAAVAAVTHRLVASCGFVGAARLGEASRQLGRMPLDRDRLQQFVDAVADLGAAGA